jgi:hypothetical protein
MSLQTRLGEKVSILVDRIVELWDGKSDNKKKNGKNAVKVSQPIAGQITGQIAGLIAGLIAGQIAGAIYGASTINKTFIKNLEQWDDGDTEIRADILYYIGI